MDKIQIECPNCGATFQASQLAEIECPYCGSKFSNPINEEKSATVIKSIIPFSTSENDFKERLFEKFIEKNQIPQDIFEHLEIRLLEQYYLPMYLFSGNYSANWSCTFVYRQKGKNGETNEDYRPQSGTVSGHFSKLTLAISGNDLPQELKKSIEVIDCTSKLLSNKIKYMPSCLINERGESIHVSEQIISKDEAWNKNSLNKSIQQDGEDAAQSQMSGWVTQDRRVSVSFHGGLNDIVLLSVWYGKYTYKDQEFFFVMDGSGDVFDFSSPKNDGYWHRPIKQIFALLGGLILLCIVWGCLVRHPGIIWLIALISFMFLSFRYTYEFRKSIKDIKANKQIDKAIFCNDDKPSIVSSNYVSVKKQNRFLTWVCVALILITGTCSAIKDIQWQKEKNQYLQTRHETTQRVQKQSDIDNAYSGNETKLNLEKADASFDEVSSGLTFRTFTEGFTETGTGSNVVVQIRLSNEQVVKNLKRLGFELVKSETKSHYDIVEDVYYNVMVSTYTKTVNGNSTTVILDEASNTRIFFPSLNDVKAFGETARLCGLKETEDGFEDAEEIYWAGTNVYVEGKTVALQYKSER